MIYAWKKFVLMVLFSVIGVICTASAQTVEHDFNINSQSDFDKAMMEIYPLFKEGKAKEWTILLKKVSDWANSNPARVLKGEDDTHEVVGTNISSVLTLKFIISFEQSKYNGAVFYDDAAFFAFEAVRFLEGAKDDFYQGHLYEALYQLLQLQWFLNEKPAAVETARQMIALGSRAIVAATVDAMSHQPFPQEIDDGQEPRLVGINYLSRQIDYLNAALLASSVSPEELAEVIALRKGLVTETITNTVVSLLRRSPDNVLNQGKTPNEEEAYLFRKIGLLGDLRRNAQTVSMLAYSSKAIEPESTARPFTLQEERAALERRFFGEVPISGKDVTLKDIEEAIPPNYLVVEYSTFAPPDTRFREGKPTHYLAIALTHEGVVDVFDAGDAAEIDLMLYEACRAVVNDTNPNSECPHPAIKIDHVKTIRPVREVGRKLYEILLGRLDQRLKHNIIISPAGAIGFLPFEMLVGSDGQFLVMDHVISYVESVRELLHWNDYAPSGQPPVFIGNPDYDSDEKHFSERCSGLSHAQSSWLAESKLYFSLLCSTSQEIEHLHEAFPGSTVIQGEQATVSRLRELHAPKILHFATHGFMLPELTWSPQWKVSAQNWTTQDYALLRSDPLLRAGLALTGANIRQGPGGHDAGILTAGEIRFINLVGTQLVVLSACDSGQGMVVSGEAGALGLRSAFREAGARAQTISLWEVNPSSSFELMDSYYEALEKYGNAEALAIAKRHFINAGGKLALPWTWAGRVAYGNPGRLSQ